MTNRRERNSPQEADQLLRSLGVYTSGGEDPCVSIARLQLTNEELDTLDRGDKLAESIMTKFGPHLTPDDIDLIFIQVELEVSGYLEVVYKYGDCYQFAHDSLSDKGELQ